MSEQLWARVAERLDEHGYMSGIERTVERIRSTAEIFTPTPLVLEMMQYVDLHIFAPGRTVLDPACGDGQFLVAAKWIKVYHHNQTEMAALEDLYGVDVMRDNVDVCKRRLQGGTILMGDALAPERQLPGQTEREWRRMSELFEARTATVRKRPGRLKKVAQTQVGRADELLF